jgi:hypothetical protein
MKNLIISLVFLTILLNIAAKAAEREKAPDWIKAQQAWEEKIDGKIYVYAVGTAEYNEKMTETESIESFKKALEESARKLKAYLRVEKLASFQLLETWYPITSAERLYVLTAVPKELNQSASQSAAPAPVKECGSDWDTGPEVFKCNRAGRDYLYARGTALIAEAGNSVNSAIGLAMVQAKKMLAQHLNVVQLTGFEVIDKKTNEQQVWVLGRVPADQPVATQQAETPPASAESAPMTMEEAADSVGVQVCKQVPPEWWVYYEGPTNPLKNVFRVGDDLYAVGMGKPNPKSQSAQYWAGAKRAAVIDAQRSLAAVLGKMMVKVNSEGDYAVRISGAVKGAQTVYNHYEQSPNTAYVLLHVSLDNIQE